MASPQQGARLAHWPARVCACYPSQNDPRQTIHSPHQHLFAQLTATICALGYLISLLLKAVMGVRVNNSGCSIRLIVKLYISTSDDLSRDIVLGSI